MRGLLCILRKILVLIAWRFKGCGASTLHDRWDTVPNAITMFGILLIPVYVGFFTTGSHEIFIPIISGVIACTDVLDGWLADYLNQHSRMGKCIDPLRDRLYLIAVFFNLFFLSVPGIIIPAFIIAGTEGGIIINGLLQYYCCGKPLEVHWIGKLRMTVHTLCASIFLVQEYWLSHYINALLLIYIMTAISIVTFFAYMRGRVMADITSHTQY